MSRDSSRPGSHPGSTMSINNSDLNPSDIAHNLGDDVTENVCGEFEGDAPHMQDLGLRAENERLRNELVLLRPLLEVAQNDLGRERESREAYESKVELLESQLQDAQSQLQDAQCRENQLREDYCACSEALARSKSEAAEARKELERFVQEQHSSFEDKASRETALEDENSVLRERISSLQEALSAKPTMDLPSEPTEDAGAPDSAYKQIAALNTQLARLYTELTLARAEAQKLRGDASPEVSDGTEGVVSNPGGDTGRNASASTRAAESQKHSQQIADLVSDIRHLQLDLQYHQEKLDQMIGEKQQLMVENKKMATDLADAKQVLEERDQELKHLRVDLDHKQEEAKLLAASGNRITCDSETLVALRTEAAAKDSALVVAHYELHKEKLVRDRLEQKNAKLMDRMNKLMMVVESMRKEERYLKDALETKGQQLEEKEFRMRESMRKAKIMQNKASKGASKKLVLESSLEFESPAQHELPRLDSARRRQIDAAGGRSGVSTPRSARGAPASPYTTR